MSKFKPVPKAPNSKNKQNDENKNLEADVKMPKKIWNFLFANKAAMWTAVFTGVLTLFTVKMWQVADTNSQTTRSSQRALMNLQGFVLGPRLNSSGHWVSQEVYLNWVNTGDTAAKTAIFQSAVKPELEELREGFDFPLAPDKTEGVVAPKGTFAVTLQIPVDQLMDAWNNKTKLFLWGDVVYKDVFPGDPERLSENCIEISHLVAVASLGDPNVGLSGVSWKPRPKGLHICYDEDCKDYQDRIKDMRQ